MTHFQHDCNSCESLGEFEGRDLYRCQDSVLARYGNDGEMYSSSLLSIARRFEQGPLHEAYKRFMEQPAGATWLKREAVGTLLFYARDLSREDWVEIKQEMDLGRPVPGWVGDEMKRAIKDLVGDQ